MRRAPQLGSFAAFLLVAATPLSLLAEERAPAQPPAAAPAVPAKTPAPAAAPASAAAAAPAPSVPAAPATPATAAAAPAAAPAAPTPPPPDPNAAVAPAAAAASATGAAPAGAAAAAAPTAPAARKATLGPVFVIGGGAKAAAGQAGASGTTSTSVSVSGGKAQRAAKLPGKNDEDPDAGYLVEGEVLHSKRLPFRGSAIIYENMFSAYSLNKNAELTYNPYYVMSWSFRPRWYFTDKFSLRLRFDVEQELTNADDTTHYRQPMVSDLILDAVYSPLTEPFTKISFAPKLRLTIPTSLASRGSSMYLGLGVGFDLWRDFKLLKGLTLLYSFRTTKYFNKYSDTSYSGPTIDIEGAGPAYIDRFSHGGGRNVSWQFNNTLEAKLAFTRRLYFTVDVMFYNRLLYPLSPTSEPVDPYQYNTDHRASIWYICDLSYDVLDSLTLSIGTSTYNPQLDESSNYRAPFFNRFTNIYFDITLNVDAFYDWVHGMVTRHPKSKPYQPTQWSGTDE